MVYPEYKNSPLQRVLQFGIGEIATLYNSYLDNEFAKNYLNEFRDFLKFMDEDFFPRFSKGGPDGFMAKAGLAKSALSLGAKALAYARMSKELRSNGKPEKLRYDVAKLRTAILNELKDQEREKFSCLAPFLDLKKLSLPDFVLDMVGRIFEDKDQANYKKFIQDQLAYQDSIIQAYERMHPLQNILMQNSSEDDNAEEEKDNDIKEEIEEYDDSSDDESSVLSSSTVAPVDSPVVIENGREENTSPIPSVLALQKVRDGEARLQNEITELSNQLEVNKTAYNALKESIHSVNQTLEKMAAYLAEAPEGDEAWVAFFDALENLIPDDSAKPKPHIPFRSFDMSKLLIPKMTGLKAGFDLLLTLLNTSNELRNAWKSYREIQENPIKKAHAKKDYIAQRTLLIQAIQSQKRMMETKISETEKQRKLEESHLQQVRVLREKMDALENLHQSIHVLEFDVLVETQALEMDVKYKEMEVEYKADVASLLQVGASGHKEAMNATKKREKKEKQAADVQRTLLLQHEKELDKALKELDKELKVAKKQHEEEKPELTFVIHLQEKPQYQYLNQAVKGALSSYCVTKDPESVLLAIINEKKLVVQDSKEDQFLDNIYWKVQFCSAGVAYPKEPDKNPILAMKHRISRISPEYMTALNRIDERLIQMKKHGLKLQCQKEPCAEKMILLERQLRIILERFILQHSDGKAVSLEGLQTFKKAFGEKLRAPYNDPSMSNHRAKWKQWVANVALALTSFVSYFVRTRHTALKIGRATEGHDTFFFHQTDRQHQIDFVEDALNKLEDVKKPTK